MAGTPIVVGLGEVLWDMLPAGKQLGGAPANFAYHAQMMGAAGTMVSAVGDDELGREIIGKLQRMKVETRYVQINRRWPTGTVSVSLEAGKPTYVIHESVAWDAIGWEEELTELAMAADAVCVGSLAQRSFILRSTIHAFLQHTRRECLRVFDLNLRQQFYVREIIEATLGLCEVLKLNDEEWPVLARMLGIGEDVEGGLAELMTRYELKLIALTRGAAGSLLVTPEGRHREGGREVKVVDTVGAGDAFTAALVMGWLRKMPLERIHTQAAAVAAYVCTQGGATPTMPRELRGST